MKTRTAVKELSEYKDLKTQWLPVTNECEQQEYTAMLIHDSFGTPLRAYLSQHFRKITYIHYMNFEDAKPLVVSERPDVVIDLRVARNLEKALRPDPELENMLAE